MAQQGGATGGETGAGIGGSPFQSSDAAVEFITADTSAEAAPSVDANCGNVPFGVKPGPADVLIVLDKSGSMAMAPNGSNCGAGSAANCSKWVQVTDAINTVVGQTPGVNWGLKFFATAAGCGVNAGAEVPVGPGTAPMIAAAIAANGPASSTPTTAAELAAGAYMATLTDTNKKFILLATDGQPTCGPGGGQGGGADDAAAIASVSTVFNGTPRLSHVRRRSRDQWRGRRRYAVSDGGDGWASPRARGHSSGPGVLLCRQHRRTW